MSNNTTFKRLDLNHGGYKDGVTFRIDPELMQAKKSDFLSQTEIMALRTARVVTRDDKGFVKVCDAAEEVPMGLVSFGYLDRLDTHEDYNALSTGDGEGLSVAIGRFGATLPINTTIFDGADVAEIKGKAIAGVKVLTTEGKDGRIALEEGVEEIGYITLVGDDELTIEFKL